MIETSDALPMSFIITATEQNTTSGTRRESMVVFIRIWI